MKNPTLSQQRVNQHKSNYSQSKGNQSSRICINNIKLLLTTHKFLNLNANSKLSILITISPVNTHNLLDPISFEKLGTIKTAPSQPADKLINKSAKIEFQTANAFINHHHTNQFTMMSNL